MEKQIIVITTQINGNKNFIANQMTTAEGGRFKVVNYCRDPALAKEFDSADEAYSFIPKIKNPHERHFEVSTVTVNMVKRNQMLQQHKEEPVLS